MLYRLEKIKCQYGRRTVLDIDALELPGGELLCITGDNGAGKSTLLQLLALLQPAKGGKLWLDGQEVPGRGRALRDLRNSVTLVHQQPLLLRGSVRENIAYGLKLRRLPAGERQHRIAWALQSVGLAGFEERSAQQLSGGEIRRVALARALALKPRVLLLDEPFAGLDQRQSRSFESLLGSLQRHGQTIILSTHDPELVRRLEAPTVHLRDGRPDSHITMQEEPICRPRLKLHEV